MPGQPIPRLFVLQLMYAAAAVDRDRAPSLIYQKTFG